MSKIRFVGLDVDAETIAVAVAESVGEVRLEVTLADCDGRLRGEHFTSPHQTQNQRPAFLLPGKPA